MLDRLNTELQNVPNLLPPAPTNSKMKNYICPSPVKKGTSFVTNVFGGTLLSEVRCLVCGQESKKHDPFLDLSLDIPEKYYKEVDDIEKKQPYCDISDCLSSFVSVEELTETELYNCNNCKQKQRSTKRFWIRRLPNVLCLHIKRFRWNSYYRWETQSYWMCKLVFWRFSFLEQKSTCAFTFPWQLWILQSLCWTVDLKPDARTRAAFTIWPRSLSIMGPELQMVITPHTPTTTAFGCILTTAQWKRYLKTLSLGANLTSCSIRSARAMQAMLPKRPFTWWLSFEIKLRDWWFSIDFPAAIKISPFHVISTKLFRSSGLWIILSNKLSRKTLNSSQIRFP